MLKKIIRVTLLGIIVVLGFTIIFPGWYDNKHIILDEITSKFMSKDDLIIRDDARRKNIPFKAYKEQVLNKRKARKLREENLQSLAHAINTQDDQLLEKTLIATKKRNIPYDIYAQVIEKSYLKGIDIIHENGIPCTATPQYLKDNQVSPNQGSIHRATINAVLSSNSEILEKWLSLDCHTIQPKFLARFVKDSRAIPLTENLTENKNNQLFLENLLWESVSNNKVKLTTHLRNQGISFSDDFLRSMNQERYSSGKKIDFLTSFVKKRKMDVVAIILEDQPNYISENKIDQNIFDALKNGSQSKGIYDVLKSSYISKDALDFNPSTELEQAVTKGNLTRVMWLLSLDPDLDFSTLQNKNIEYISFERSLRWDNVKNVPILAARKFDFSLLRYQGLDQLSDAISRGKIDIVKLLLDLGVKTNTLYRGNSILNIANTLKVENKQKIIDLLIANGAHNDLGKLVRQETGVQYDPQCKVGKQSIQNYGSNNDHINQINQSLQQRARSKVDNYGICHVSLLLCTKDNKNSLDNCFASAPSCSDESQTSSFSKENPVTSLCCPAAAKSRYNEMRCSGLDVVSSSLMLRDMGFPETHSIPTFMLNTPEYQKLNNTQRRKTFSEPTIPNSKTKR